MNAKILAIWEDTVTNWKRANAFAPLPVPSLQDYSCLLGRQKALIDTFLKRVKAAQLSDR